MTTKTILYNLALGMLGSRQIASLSEAREPRRVLDQFYDSVTAFALSKGFWNFAIRTVQSTASTSIEPPFGYTEAHAKPDDWVRTYKVSENETLDPPLLDYVDEAGYIYAYTDPLYIRYISNHTSYGMDLSLWSSTFEDYVARRLANKACKRLTGADPSQEMLLGEKRALAEAKSADAMDEPPAFPPTGSWVRSRGGGWINKSRWNGQLE